MCPSQHISEICSVGAKQTINLLSFWSISVFCRPFEGHACVYMGVWNEGELTDGGWHIVSGQYHHGPVSLNIIWALSCVAFFPGVTWQQRVEERKREKADGVYLTEENLKSSWVECE